MRKSTLPGFFKALPDLSIRIVPSLRRYDPDQVRRVRLSPKRPSSLARIALNLLAEF